MKKIQKTKAKPRKHDAKQPRARTKKPATVKAAKLPPLRDEKGRFIRMITQDDLLSTDELEQSKHEEIRFEYVERPSRDVSELAFAELNNRIVRQKEWEENEARLLLQEVERQLQLKMEEKKLRNKAKNFALSSWYELKYTALMGKIWLVESLWVKPVKSIRLTGTRVKNYFKK